MGYGHAIAPGRGKPAHFMHSTREAMSDATATETPMSVAGSMMNRERR